MGWGPARSKRFPVGQDAWRKRLDEMIEKGSDRGGEALSCREYDVYEAVEAVPLRQDMNELPLREMSAARVVREKRYPYAFCSRVPDRREIAGAYSRVVPYSLRLALRPDQRPLRLAQLLACAEGRQAAKLADVAASRDGEVKVANENLPGYPQGSHLQSSAAVELCADAQRQVDAVVERVDRPVHGKHLQPHFRIPAQKQRQRRRDDFKQSFGTAEAHVPFWFALHFRDKGFGHLCFFDDRAAVLIEGAAEFGNADMPRRSFDEADAEPLLESGYAAAQLRLGDSQHTARGGEATMRNHLCVVQIVVQISVFDG